MWGHWNGSQYLLLPIGPNSEREEERERETERALLSETRCGQTRWIGRDLARGSGNGLQSKMFSAFRGGQL